jgi:hypothetical protein
MTRRFWLRRFALSLGWLASVAGWHWHLVSACLADEQQATLNEQLRSILKCRRPEEFAYVDLVTAKVDSGELPLPLVLSMMQWARKRSRQEVQNHSRKTDIPFPYFQQGLKLRAAEIGVDLPAFTVTIGP